MNYLKIAWEFLNGKKTYIVAVAGVFFAVTQVWSGAMSPQEAFEAILGFLGLSAIRHGISK